MGSQDQSTRSVSTGSGGTELGSQDQSTGSVSIGSGRAEVELGSQESVHRVW